MDTAHLLPTYGFTTMGCPEASLVEVVDLANQFAMDFIELRALAGSTNLPTYFAENPPGNSFAQPAPGIRLVATNLALSKATDAEIADFLRFVDVAIMLRAPYVRVFGGGIWGDPFSKEDWKRAIQTVNQCRTAISEKKGQCEILLETHNTFSSTGMCLRLNEQLEVPLSFLWDTHHTWRSAGESFAESWGKIGPSVRHIHVSDSRLKSPQGTNYDSVLPGTGEFPFARLRDFLSKVGYAHGVSLEWEKIWHPELPDIRPALKEFHRLMPGAMLNPSS